MDVLATCERYYALDLRHLQLGDLWQSLLVERDFQGFLLPPSRSDPSPSAGPLCTYRYGFVSSAVKPAGSQLIDRPMLASYHRLRLFCKPVAFSRGRAVKPKRQSTAAALRVTGFVWPSNSPEGVVSAGGSPPLSVAGQIAIARSRTVPRLSVNGSTSVPGTDRSFPAPSPWPSPGGRGDNCSSDSNWSTAGPHR